jgi:hypothetical protein
VKKVIYSLVAIGILATSFGGGWVASTAFAEQKVPAEPILQPAVNVEKFVDKSNGQGMASDEMYTELQTQSGEQFDSKYIAYVILLQNNFAGMNRLAKEKAVNTDIKDKATDMWQSSTQTVTDLYALQRKAGYAHH